MILKSPSTIFLYLTPWLYGVFFIFYILVVDAYFKVDGRWSSTANTIGNVLFYLLFISGFIALGFYVVLLEKRAYWKAILIQLTIQSINICFFCFIFFFLFLVIFGFPAQD